MHMHFQFSLSFPDGVTTLINKKKGMAQRQVQPLRYRANNIFIDEHVFRQKITARSTVIYSKVNQLN